MVVNITSFRINTYRKVINVLINVQIDVLINVNMSKNINCWYFFCLRQTLIGTLIGTLIVTLIRTLIFPTVNYPKIYFEHELLESHDKRIH